MVGAVGDSEDDVYLATGTVADNNKLSSDFSHGGGVEQRMAWWSPSRAVAVATHVPSFKLRTGPPMHGLHLLHVYSSALDLNHRLSFLQASTALTLFCQYLSQATSPRDPNHGLRAQADSFCQYLSSNATATSPFGCRAAFKTWNLFNGSFTTLPFILPTMNPRSCAISCWSWLLCRRPRHD